MCKPMAYLRLLPTARIYVLDHCKGLARALHHGKVGEHYNLGSNYLDRPGGGHCPAEEAVRDPWLRVKMPSTRSRLEDRWSRGSGQAARGGGLNCSEIGLHAFKKNYLPPPPREVAT